jgi:3-phosphoshikimate 1-carboxyvinyltransferase
MIFKISPGNASGSTSVPASKSHSIRAIAFASLSEGESIITNLLDSDDSSSALKVYESFGARVSRNKKNTKIKGFNGNPKVSNSIINVGNSGTTCRIALGTAVLLENEYANFDGDSQTRNRPMGPLLSALKNLGAKIKSDAQSENLPISIGGPWNGGSTRIDGITSQFTTSLLINSPFGLNTTYIEPFNLNEKPYVEMTLWWLDKLGLQFSHDNLEKFEIPGGQTLKSFKTGVPADFSSAAFLAAAGALPGGNVRLSGLDFTDPQGDKIFFQILESMGAKVTNHNDGSIQVTGHNLTGGEYDLNDTPDLLPILSILGAFANGETRIVNVPQARIKETDRISSMKSVIEDLGGRAKESKDGLTIYGEGLTGGRTTGFSDHRIVMACAIAGLASTNPVEVDTAEATSITFPDFTDKMDDLNVNIQTQNK